MHSTESSNIQNKDLSVTNRPIRILHVIGGMNRGGIETWLMHILRNIDRQKFQMDFLVGVEEPCAYDDEIRSLGGNIICCPLSKRQPWKYTSQLKDLLLEHGPYDIIHSQVYFFSGIVLRVAEKVNIPTRIVHVHPLSDIKEKDLLRPLYRSFMTNLIARHSNWLLTPSKNTLEAFKAICDCSKMNVEILYNGVDLPKFKKTIDRDAVRRQYSLPVDQPIVIFVARFAPHKNHLQMLRVAAQVKQQGEKVHWVMVGSHGEMLPTLRAKTAELDNVSLLEGVADISELLLAADLFFFPSVEEGFGVVAIEAAAAGLPVVATNLDTIAEACAPSNRNYMFPPNDDDTARKNILKIIRDANLRASLATDAQKWADNFDIKNSVNGLSSIYLQAQSTSRDVGSNSQALSSSK